MAVKNLVSGTLAGDITTSTTNILVHIADNISAQGITDFFPNPPFYITIMPKAPASGVSNRLDSEIIKITNVGHDQVGNAALTGVRAQRDTTAKAFSTGDIVTVGVYAEDAVFLADSGVSGGSTYRKKLVDKDGNTIVPALPEGSIGTADIAGNAITADKIDWSTVGNIATPATGRNVVKFGNGLMICYGKVTGSIDINISVTALYSGTCYRSVGLPAITFGATFISAPSVSVDIHPPANSTASFSVTPFVKSGASTTGIPSEAYVITRSGSRTGVAYEYDYIAIGKWK